MAFITKVKEYREKAKYKQSELAEMVNARRETIVHLENGKYNPSLKLAMDIAKVFNVSVEDLFEFTDETFIVLSLGISEAFILFAFMISSLLFLDVLPKNFPIISWNKICPTTVKIPNLFILLLINFLVFSLSSTIIFSMPN